MILIAHRTLGPLLLGVALSACSSSESPSSPASDQPEVPAAGAGATPADDATSPDVAYCAQPGETTAPNDQFVTFDASSYDAFTTVFEGVGPGPEATVTASFLFAPAKYVVAIASALVCSHEQYRVDRCANTLNPRLEGEVLSFTLVNPDDGATQDFVIGNEAYTSVNVIDTQASGEVTSTNIVRDASGTETLVEASSLGSGLTIVENPDCSGSYTGNGEQSGESIDFEWSSPRAANLELTYTVCEVADGCESGTLP